MSRINMLDALAGLGWSGLGGMVMLLVLWHARRWREEREERQAHRGRGPGREVPRSGPPTAGHAHAEQWRDRGQYVRDVRDVPVVQVRPLIEDVGRQLLMQLRVDEAAPDHSWRDRPFIERINIYFHASMRSRDEGSGDRGDRDEDDEMEDMT